MCGPRLRRHLQPAWPGRGYGAEAAGYFLVSAGRNPDRDCGRGTALSAHAGTQRSLGVSEHPAVVAAPLIRSGNTALLHGKSKVLEARLPVSSPLIEPRFYLCP